ncbi:ABC transporter ATP-binding protein [Undibacterium sp. Di27W]|uniref:ABC transporter ATP-binding protein n=1 Tax=Undibacterium sp. Di27W TaxID=3413036 RepID=UPI003BF109C9
MAYVSLKNLGIELGGYKIIEQLDLDVQEGEFLVLLGPSGCGKSTLLHSIAGLIDIATGSIEIAGKDVSHAEPSDRQIGMVFQSYALYPTMTVEKNMSFGLRINGVPKAEIHKRIARVAEMLQLQSLLQRKPAQLSGGQRQRVAIGRALVREARVFLFDEPLSNLDAKLRTELRRELKLLHQNLGSTMLYVTHDQVEAMSLASRIVVMRAGKIQQLGTPSEVYERPANLFVAGFLGAPAMNFIAGKLDSEKKFINEHIQLDLSAYAASPQATRAEDVVLGVRPEHMHIHAHGTYSVQLSLVEPMGNHQLLWLKLGNQSLCVLDHDNRSFSLNENLRFNIDTAKVSLFNAGTGMRL